MQISEQQSTQQEQYRKNTTTKVVPNRAAQESNCASNTTECKLQRPVPKAVLGFYSGTFTFSLSKLEQAGLVLSRCFVAVVSCATLFSFCSTVPV